MFGTALRGTTAAYFWNALTDEKTWSLPGGKQSRNSKGGVSPGAVSSGEATAADSNPLSSLGEYDSDSD